MKKEHTQFIDISNQEEQKMIKIKAEIVGSNSLLRIVHFDKERKDILFSGKSVYMLLDVLIGIFRQYIIKKLKKSGVEID